MTEAEGECRGNQGRRRIDWRWWEERQRGGDVDVDGWRGDGDGGACTHITCLVSCGLVSEVSVCVSLTIWFRNLFSKLGVQLAPIPLFGDNQGSIFLASNPVQEKHIKHIDLRYHFIRDTIQTRQVELYFIEGAQNPADMFTKNLGRIKFHQFREYLGLEFYSS